jgi:hypothetical protein
MFLFQGVGRLGVYLLEERLAWRVLLQCMMTKFYNVAYAKPGPTSVDRRLARALAAPAASATFGALQT